MPELKSSPDQKVVVGGGDESSNGSHDYAKELFPQEEPGWIGYIEWEKYPERRAKAAEILKQHKSHFDPVRASSAPACSSG